MRNIYKILGEIIVNSYKYDTNQVQEKFSLHRENFRFRNDERHKNGFSNNPSTIRHSLNIP